MGEEYEILEGYKKLLELAKTENPSLSQELEHFNSFQTIIGDVVQFQALERETPLMTSNYFSEY